MRKEEKPIAGRKTDICLLCGKPKGTSDFGLICMKCYNKLSGGDKKRSGLLEE